MNTGIRIPQLGVGVMAPTVRVVVTTAELSDRVAKIVIGCFQGGHLRLHLGHLGLERSNLAAE